ncbi:MULTISPECIES: FkbM family methyltransferase [unclassified Mesorhizobium]|uniref:FkbM family methyltransferase n=1 Tax=unclassified Mesorhizobium TaxID=325217 RepID=UPI0019D49049|nr:MULTISPECIES: FkbM family methyltransferase [unclassified Mesorhizobium]
MQKAFRSVGLDVTIYGPRHNPGLRLVDFLKTHEIDLVFDVGANRGQFAKEIFASGFSGRLVSFEPLPDVHAKLIEEAKLSGQRWEVAPPMALSDEAGVAEFQITHSDASSSLLHPTADLVSTLPQVGVVKKVQVQTERLDVAATPYLSQSRRPFLKVDVQGAEGQVLRGGANVLERCHGAIVETGVEKLYHGQSSVQDILLLLLNSGFEVWDISTAYRSPKTHRLGQVDITCFRP